MHRLTYNNRDVWYFPSVALCKWKIIKLKATGNYSQEFKIEKV